MHLGKEATELIWREDATCEHLERHVHRDHVSNIWTQYKYLLILCRFSFQLVCSRRRQHSGFFSHKKKLAALVAVSFLN